MIAGTHGVSVEVKLGADITGYTNAHLVILSPSGVRTIVQATVLDVKSGIIQYISKVGVFNIVTSVKKKHYKVQASVTFANALLKSTIVDLEVEESL
jgi:hypothetical protein